MFIIYENFIKLPVILVLGSSYHAVLSEMNTIIYYIHYVI